MPTLDRITIYPVKSLDGVDLDEARVLPSGALEHDRRWQLTDMDGRVLNAKRSPLFHAIRADFDLVDPAARAAVPGAVNRITLAVHPEALHAAALPDVERLAGLATDTFSLVPGPGGPCDWLAEALGQPVLLLERPDGGFPDDREAPGPTVISTATLAEVARWFGLDPDEARRRFRANLEIGGCDAFWEDALASPARPGLAPSLLDLPADLAVDPCADLPPPEPREFSVGAIRFRATNVCRRCAVPTRDSRSGAVTTHFRDAFEARRRRSLRPDVDAAAWGTLYRLGVNTRSAGGGRLAVGSHFAVAADDHSGGSGTFRAGL